MDMETFAQRVEALRPRLYRTAFCYMGSEAMALDVLDEAVYRGLKSLKKLRQPAVSPPAASLDKGSVYYA